MGQKGKKGCQVVIDSPALQCKEVSDWKGGVRGRGGQRITFVSKRTETRDGKNAPKEGKKEQTSLAKLKNACCSGVSSAKGI